MSDIYKKFELNMNKKMLPKQYIEVFEIELDGVKTIYKIRALDYTDAMFTIYKHIQRKCMLECYNKKTTLSITYIGREEEEYDEL